MLNAFKPGLFMNLGPPSDFALKEKHMASLSDTFQVKQTPVDNSIKTNLDQAGAEDF